MRVSSQPDCVERSHVESQSAKDSNSRGASTGLVGESEASDRSVFDGDVLAEPNIVHRRGGQGVGGRGDGDDVVRTVQPSIGCGISPGSTKSPNVPAVPIRPCSSKYTARGISCSEPNSSLQSELGEYVLTPLK